MFRDRETAMRCEMGSDGFSSHVDPIVQIRHSMANSSARSADSSQIDDLRLKLSVAAASLKKLYAQANEFCENQGLLESCGFAYAYEKFVGLFGPLDSTRPKTNPPEKQAIPALHSGYLMPTAQIAGETVQVILDTGASFTVFSEKWASAHPQTLSKLGSITGHNLPFFAVSGYEFVFNGTSFRPQVAVTSPIVDLFEGSDINNKRAAIVGLDFILGRDIEVNNDEHFIVLDAPVAPDIANGEWSSVPLTLHGGLLGYTLGVDVFVNGSPIHMLLDTGATNSSIDEHCLDRLPAVIANNSKRRISAHASGFSVDKVVGDAQIKLGDAKPVVTQLGVLSNSHPSELSSTGFCGILGNDVLRHSNFILDTGNFMLHLSPRKTKAKSYNQIDFGITLKRKGKYMVVDNVSPNSLAEKAGVKKGDFLLQVDGRDISTISRFEFAEITRFYETTLNLTILRNGKKKIISVGEQAAYFSHESVSKNQRTGTSSTKSR